MLSDIARNHMITFVMTNAASLAGGGSRRRSGGEGMNWIQNQTPVSEEARVHQPDMHVLASLS